MPKSIRMDLGIIAPLGVGPPGKGSQSIRRRCQGSLPLRPSDGVAARIFSLPLRSRDGVAGRRDGLRDGLREGIVFDGREALKGTVRRPVYLSLIHI